MVSLLALACRKLQFFRTAVYAALNDLSREALKVKEEVSSARADVASKRMKATLASNFFIGAASLAFGRERLPRHLESETDADLARSLPLAPAPTVLQRSGHRKIPITLGAVARAQGLLRNGEAAGRISHRPPDDQPGSFFDLAD